MSEAEIYGMKPIIKSFDFLSETNIRVKNGESLSKLVKEELKKYRVVSGYARPIIKEDERIKPLTDLARKLGLGSGEHIKLAFDIEKTLISLGYKMHANIASIAAGLVADQGLTAREYYYYLVNCFSIGILLCHFDSSRKKEGLLFPIRCTKVVYQGNSNRVW
ncbi:MAG: hypothetical protein AB8B92_03645 [Gammaproteobacteria bacterium]